jgi:hypothetical protein
MRMMPEQRHIFHRRFRILYELYGSVDVGRRVLSVRTALTPAVVRKECSTLVQAGLLTAGRDGMRLTVQGHRWLEEAKGWMPELFETVQLEKWLMDTLEGWQVSLLPEAAPEDCSYIRNAHTDKLSAQLRQWLQEKNVSFEWSGNYYDYTGKLLYRNKEQSVQNNDICITAEVDSATGVGLLLQSLIPGRVWMSLEYGRHLWKNYQERG